MLHFQGKNVTVANYSTYAGQILAFTRTYNFFEYKTNQGSNIVKRRQYNGQPIGL